MSHITLPENVRHIHCVGIGGAGVSALVPALLERGYSVSGSDPAENEAVIRLKNRGVKIIHHHQKENIENVDLIVATAAVKTDHVELAAASDRGIPVWHRAKMLAYLLQDQKSVVVTGAHGKTTVTAMIAHILIEAGMDPSVYAGGEIAAICANAYVGRGEWAVAEGDESDGSFTYFQPDVAVINNIDMDHLDHYGSLDAILKSFESFLSNIKSDGWILLSADCEHTSQLKNNITNQNILTYGFNKDADIRGIEYHRNGTGWCCDVALHDEDNCVLRMPVCGRMNYHNALAAIAVAKVLHVSVRDAVDALSTFLGVKRRMEAKGVVRGVHVFDDYAHHPVEIQSTIRAFRDQTQDRLIVIFQPHLFSRTEQLLNEFSESFEHIDLAIISDIYAARELPKPGVNGELLTRALRRNGVPVVYFPDWKEIPSYLMRILQEGDTVVTMGAGDIWKSGDEYLRLAGVDHG